MAQLGDIFERTIDGITRRYTIAEIKGNAHGGRDVVGRAKYHIADTVSRSHAFTRDEAGITITVSPTFADGASVKVGDRRGAVVTDTGGDTVLVALQAEEHALEDGIKVTVEAITQPVPRWLLVWDNVLP
jgi:hypothetical protein